MTTDLDRRTNPAHGRGRVLAALALLASSALGAAETVPARDPVLFEYRGRDYGAADIGPKLGKALHELQVRQYEELTALIDEALFEMYLSDEAVRTGETRRQVAERLLSVAEPSEEEVERFYADNRLRINDSLDKIRHQIVRHLKREALIARKTALIERMKSEGRFAAAHQPAPEPPVSFDLHEFPVRGPVDAPITVVEFGDYQCPRCRRAVSIFKGLLDRHPDAVRLVYLDMPVNRSGVSRRVAEGAVCADAQDAYWAYHDLAFERQESLDPDSARVLARDLELDLETFDACLAGREPGARVRRAEKQARALGLDATPSVYVNGRPLASNDLAGALETRIETLLGAR